MKGITVKSIVEFRARKTDRGRKNFAETLNKNEEKDIDKDENPRDYWIRCLSAISNAYKQSNIKLIDDKINELKKLLKENISERTKNMYNRNLNILHKYENYDFKDWKFSQNQTFIKSLKIHSPIKVNSLFVKVKPHSIFSFNKNGIDEIGAIWFIAKKDGFSKEDLGMFADILYRYLKKHYSNNYNVNPEYCIAVDVFNENDVDYLQIQNGEIKAALIPTINEINKLL